MCLFACLSICLSSLIFFFLHFLSLNQYKKGYYIIHYYSKCSLSGGTCSIWHCYFPQRRKETCNEELSALVPLFQDHFSKRYLFYIVIHKSLHQLRMFSHALPPIHVESRMCSQSHPLASQSCPSPSPPPTPPPSLSFLPLASLPYWTYSL